MIQKSLKSNNSPKKYDQKFEFSKFLYSTYVHIIFENLIF